MDWRDSFRIGRDLIVLLSAMGAHIRKLNFDKSSQNMWTARDREPEREKDEVVCECVCVFLLLKPFRNSACPPWLTRKRNSKNKKVFFVGIWHAVLLVRFCTHGQRARHQRVRVSLRKWGSYQRFFLALSTRSLVGRIDTYLCLWLVGWLMSYS